MDMRLLQMSQEMRRSMLRGSQSVSKVLGIGRDDDPPYVTAFLET